MLKIQIFSHLTFFSLRKNELGRNSLIGSSITNDAHEISEYILTKFFNLIRLYPPIENMCNCALLKVFRKLTVNFTGRMLVYTLQI